MKRRTLLLATVAPLATAGCMTGGKVMGVVTSPDSPPPTRITRLLIWFPPANNLLVVDRLGRAFKTELGAYDVAVAIGQSTPLELDRARDQAPALQEIRANYRLEIEVVSSYQSRRLGASGLVAANLFAGTNRTPVLTVMYRMSDSFSTGLASAIVQTLRERGYLQ